VKLERQEFDSWQENGLLFFRHVQTGPGAQPASYPMGNGVSFSGSKAVGAWSLPIINIQCWG